MVAPRASAPQLRMASLAGLFSVPPVSAGKTGTPVPAAHVDRIEVAVLGGAEPSADEDAAEDAAAVLVPLDKGPKPQRFSTAILSRSSAERMPAFLTTRCFLRRSFRATRRASCTSFIAFVMAAFACAMESSKSMRGRFARALAFGWSERGALAVTSSSPRAEPTDFELAASVKLAMQATGARGSRP